MSLFTRKNKEDSRKRLATTEVTIFVYMGNSVGSDKVSSEENANSGAAIVYPVVCGLHGLGFGTMYAPAQAFLFGLDFEGMIAWIVAGLPWDIVHGIGDFAVGFLILPLVKLLRKMDSYIYM